MSVDKDLYVVKKNSMNKIMDIVLFVKIFFIFFFYGFVCASPRVQASFIVDECLANGNDSSNQELEKRMLAFECMFLDYMQKSEKKNNHMSESIQKFVSIFSKMAMRIIDIEQAIQTAQQEQIDFYEVFTVLEEKLSEMKELEMQQKKLQARFYKEYAQLSSLVQLEDETWESFFKSIKASFLLTCK